MDKNSDARQEIKAFLMELGVPEELRIDGSKEQKSPGTYIMNCCQRNDILLTRTYP